MLALLTYLDFAFCLILHSILPSSTFFFVHRHLLPNVYLFERGITFPLYPPCTYSGTVLHDAEVLRSLNLGQQEILNCCNLTLLDNTTELNSMSMMLEGAWFSSEQVPACVGHCWHSCCRYPGSWRYQLHHKILFIIGRLNHCFFIRKYE